MSKAQKQISMTYQKMREYFQAAERHNQHFTGYIVFSQDSFEREFSEKSRTYVVSSNNKAYQSGKGGYSIFAGCLDGTDPCLRLDLFMQAEKGGKDGWKIERCYMMADEVNKAKALLKREQAKER
ncbi:MAG: hypothetical protein HFF06_10880 [Oscillospiraceae bacterium]|jgi:hypothetical protein|nr:hypothetical protein [Oscillospiraceae bacterium]